MTDKRKIIILVIVLCCFSITLVGISFAWAGFGSSSSGEVNSNVSFPAIKSCITNRSVVFAKTDCALAIDPEKMTAENASTTYVSSGQCSITTTLNGCAGDTAEIEINLYNGPLENTTTPYCTDQWDCRDQNSGIQRFLTLKDGYFEYSGKYTVSGANSYTPILASGTEYNMDHIVESNMVRLTLIVPQDNQAKTATVTLNTYFYNLTPEMVDYNDSAGYYSGLINDQSWLQQSETGPSVYHHYLGATLVDTSW